MDETKSERWQEQLDNISVHILNLILKNGGIFVRKPIKNCLHVDKSLL